MRRSTFLSFKPMWPVILAAFLAAAPREGWGTDGNPVDALVFDAESRELSADSGQSDLEFAFAFTNTAPESIVIQAIRTSCGCTIVKAPSLPWGIAPGEKGEISVVLDLRGKRGTLTKSILVNTSVGAKPLVIRASLPDMRGESDDRLRNRQIANADRTAIFRGECASCHARPAEGKSGAALYVVACGICHDAPHRASMVPDLRRLTHPTSREHWLKWIASGKQGTLMPGFAASEGGPLNDEQVASLADYLSRTITERAADVSQVQLPPRGAFAAGTATSPVLPPAKSNTSRTSNLSSLVRLPPLPVVVPPTDPSTPAAQPRTDSP